MTTRGRPAFLENKKEVAMALRDLSGVSYYLTRKLAKAGYVSFEVVKSEGRGRPAKRPVLTGKGRGLVALSANWKKT